jgi:hypothetical protein
LFRNGKYKIVHYQMRAEIAHWSYLSFAPDHFHVTVSQSLEKKICR